jgi:hypothetical protein
VVAYDVLVRVCEGLGVPRGRMGLAYEGVADPRDADLADTEGTT